MVDAEVTGILRAERAPLPRPQVLTGPRLSRASRVTLPGAGEGLHRGLWAILVAGLDEVDGLAACDRDQMRAEAREILGR